jgi:hypothetical protein
MRQDGEKAVGTGDNPEWPLGKIAGIYRVNPDGTIEALESARVEAAEKASLFLTDEGVVVVIGNAQVTEKLPGYGVCPSVRSRWQNPPRARAWRRADVCTVMSLACRTGHPALAAAATRAWSSAVTQ